MFNDIYQYIPVDDKNATVIVPCHDVYEISLKIALLQAHLQMCI